MYRSCTGSDYAASIHYGISIRLYQFTCNLPSHPYCGFFIIGISDARWRPPLSSSIDGTSKCSEANNES